MERMEINSTYLYDDVVYARQRGEVFLRVCDW